MPPIKWLLYLVWLGIFSAGCVSAPQSFAIPPVDETVRTSVYGNRNYADVLPPIMSFMVRELKLPAVEGSVIVYSTQVSYEAGVISESKKDFERVRQQLGSQANQLNEEEADLSARRSAVSSIAVGMYKRVLVDGWRVDRLSWSDWLRVLAHELTHTAEKELVDGRLTSSHQWLREGFADWVGYKVATEFAQEDFIKNRDRVLDLIAEAKGYQSFPALTQLANNTQWITWLRNRGHAATYGQAFIAVDFLIDQRGLPAVVEYFRLFGKLNNRERNFMAAFGEPLTAFESRFAEHMQGLLKKSKNIAMAEETHV